ncbi:hypothetical protein MSG28_005419 [Choristoneura fumiferana]|uniref:Uncharacterized protein n=1 Tax=Choristoneura fumiferana TaxID=7141 RepID=A0ACC0JR52_CHOFU|nr:hypothetical protein MSG28_005419 [Choristoneura fumiferana]
MLMSPPAGAERGCGAARARRARTKTAAARHSAARAPQCSCSRVVGVVGRHRHAGSGMLLPDQTYEGASPASPAARAPAPLPALLRAHRVRPDFFCANRPRRSRQRDSRK